MEGKNTFTKETADKIRGLLKELRVATGDRQKAIRGKLRKIGFRISDWNGRGMTVSDFDNLIKDGSIRVIPSSNTSRLTPAKSTVSPMNISKRDEDYVIDLCDITLGHKSLRQHRFDFLCGDTGSKLPVDAYYKELNLVVEYYEKQHTESVEMFDNKMTASGVLRDEQRRKYDERRKKVLPQHGINVITISYSDFKFDSRKKIVRNEEDDLKVVRSMLKEYLK